MPSTAKRGPWFPAGTQVSKARPGAPIALFRRFIGAKAGAQFGYTAAEIAKFDSVGGESKPAMVTLQCFPIASHAAKQISAGRMIKVIRIEFTAGAQVLDHG